MSNSAGSFKRRYLINDRVTLHFSIFVLISALVVLFFLFEDYKYNTLCQTVSSAVVSGQPATGDVVKTGKAGNEFCNACNLIIMGFWLFLCAAFSLAFNRKLKPMFLLFFWLSFAVILIFVLWSYLLSLASHSENSWFYKVSMTLKYTLLSKAVVLIVWCFFSVFISFSYVTTKYLGIFNRLNYLFDSIMRGNWDSNMFFREGDVFSFLAPTFNSLKEKFLKSIYDSDEVLIQLKDKLKSTSSVTPKDKEDLLKIFQADIQK